MDAPNIIIQKEHQAAPKEIGPYKQAASGLYLSGEIIDDVTLRNNLIVQPSKIHGLGLFANRSYAPQDLIWYEQLRGNIGGIEDEGPLRWTNHSDEPNSLLVLSTQNLETRLIAIKNIQQDQEITYNYNVFGHTGSKTKCNCGSSICQGSFCLRIEWKEKR